MSIDNLPTDGSVWLNYVSGATVSYPMPSSMIENGWQFKDRSKRNKTIWQYLRPLDNGRYDEIRLDNHKREGVHYVIKIMIKKEEKPTKEQFISSIALELKKNIKKALKKDDEE